MATYIVLGVTWWGFHPNWKFKLGLEDRASKKVHKKPFLYFYKTFPWLTQLKLRRKSEHFLFFFLFFPFVFLFFVCSFLFMIFLLGFVIPENIQTGGQGRKQKDRAGENVWVEDMEFPENTAVQITIIWKWNQNMWRKVTFS